MESSAGGQAGEQTGPSGPPADLAQHPPGAGPARAGARSVPAPAPTHRGPLGAGAPLEPPQQAHRQANPGAAEPAGPVQPSPAPTSAADAVEVDAAASCIPPATNGGANEFQQASLAAAPARAAKAAHFKPSGATAAAAPVAATATTGARPGLMAPLPLRLGPMPCSLPLPWAGSILLPIPGLLPRPASAQPTGPAVCVPKQIAASSPQNGCSAAPLVMQHLQQQPLAAQQQPAPKQPLRAPTLPPQHAVGSKRSAEAALVSPPPAATLAGAGLALGIPILPHPAALAAREAAAAAAGLPAGADLPGLVVGRPLEPPSEPPAAPAAPFQPASAPGPAQAAAALPLPLFQPSATLADVAAAAARAAEAEGGPVSGNGEQQQQRVEEAGLGGTSFGSAWAGGALDEVVAAAALEEEQQPNKRSRLVWTQELHNRFINALSHLGLKNAVPKSILAMMNVEGMTRENVASHLQKYRLHLRRLGGYSEKDRVDSEALQRLHEQNVQQMAAQQVLQYSLAVMHNPPPPPAAPGLPAPGIPLPPLAPHPPSQPSAPPVTGIPLMPGSPSATLPGGPLAAVAVAAAAAAAAEARRNGSGAAAALSSRPPPPVPGGVQPNGQQSAPHNGLPTHGLKGVNGLQPAQTTVQQQPSQQQLLPPKPLQEAQARPAGSLPQLHLQPGTLPGAAHGSLATQMVAKTGMKGFRTGSKPALAAALDSGAGGSGSRPPAPAVATAGAATAGAVAPELPRLVVKTDSPKEAKAPGPGAADAPATPTDRSTC